LVVKYGTGEEEAALKRWNDTADAVTDELGKLLR
jgi:hypothetical protein